MNAYFQPTDILLPRTDIDLEKWAVIACDQYTGDPGYWKTVSDLVGNAPSAYHLIFPEIYLGGHPSAPSPSADRRIGHIQEEMRCYLDSGILTTRVTDGYVLVVRESSAGTRIGLVGALDLEQYAFTPDAKTPVRATEETVADRIPPRMKIRQNAPLELPHIMMLMEDPSCRLLEPLFERRFSLPLLYDTDLMLGGGHIRGYAVTDANAERVCEELLHMQEEAGDMFLAAGDGNHSLATAKACWDACKDSLSEKDRASHPARFALAELVNLYSPSLQFAPIHRILYHVNAKSLLASFSEYLNAQGLSLTEGDELCFLWKGAKKRRSIQGRGSRLPVEILQKFLDQYLKGCPEASIDYIHGDAALESLTSDRECANLGIALTAIDKADLFPAVASQGALPRKTFSIGEAQDKRYYMECRRI